MRSAAYWLTPVPAQLAFITSRLSCLGMVPPTVCSAHPHQSQGRLTDMASGQSDRSNPSLEVLLVVGESRLCQVDNEK